MPPSPMTGGETAVRLVIERHIRTTWLGRRFYQLSIAAEANVVELEIFDAHDLWDVDVYVSSVFLAQEQVAVGSFEAADLTKGWGNAVAWRRLRLWRESLSARRASQLESHITVRDLIDGSTHEARDVGELLTMEAGVRNGFDVLQKRIEILARYGDGDVLIVEPETKPVGVAPAQWITLR